MTKSGDDYLFDGTGAPDEDVARMERLLSPLGRRDEEPAASPTPAPVRRGPLLAFGALFAAAAAVFAVVTVQRDGAEPARTAVQPVAGPVIRETGRAAALSVGEWIETSGGGRELVVGDLGRVTLGARSRLQVRHVSDETTRLYLERGSMEALVSAAARPRFFQVDTDAARCIDLGCRYTLDVDDAGVATVRVLIGQVAFESGAREVFVPAGAECVARKGRGPGTPRFDDARDALAAAFDAYDAATTDRGRLALAALEAVRDPRDTLPAWHLLQDEDPNVAAAAAARLELVAGKCDAPAGASAAEVREAWKMRLASTSW